MSETSRSTAAAIFLNILLPGAGHLYLGRASRFLMVGLVMFVTLALFGLLELLSANQYLFIFVACVLLLYLIGIIDAAVIARSNKSQRRWYSRWYFYVLYFSSALLILKVGSPYFFRIGGVQIFKVVNGVKPIIMPDETVIFDTRAYRSGTPKVGDIVVFKIPGKDMFGVRRIPNQPTLQSVSFSTEENHRLIDSELSDVPLTNVIGRATNILFSMEKDRSGMQISYDDGRMPLSQPEAGNANSDVALLSRPGNIIQIAVGDVGHVEDLLFMLDDAGHVWGFRDPFINDMTELVQIRGLEHIKKIAPYMALDDQGQVYTWDLVDEQWKEDALKRTNYTQAKVLPSINGATDIAHCIYKGANGYAVVNGNRIVTWDETFASDPSGNTVTKYGAIKEIYSGKNVLRLASWEGQGRILPKVTLVSLLEDGTVLGWGVNEFGQETFAGGERVELGKFPNAVDIAMNDRYTMVLTKEGGVLYWGGCDHHGFNNNGKPWEWGHIKEKQGAINGVQSFAISVVGPSVFDAFLKSDGTVWLSRPPIPEDAPPDQCGRYFADPSERNFFDYSKTAQCFGEKERATQVVEGDGAIFLLDAKHRLWTMRTSIQNYTSGDQPKLVNTNLR